MVNIKKIIGWLLSPEGLSFSDRLILFISKLKYFPLQHKDKFSKSFSILIPVTITSPYGFKVRIHNGFQLNMFKSTYEPENVKLLKISKNSTFLDVGAHYGFYTLFAASKSLTGKIISIEADKDTYKNLVENVSLNGFENVECINYAAWNMDEEEIRIYKAPNDYPNASFLGTGPEFSLVKTITLDRIISNYKISSIDWMKIDVESAEVHVLEGAKNALSITKNVLIEIHTTENGLKCEKILKNSGFTMSLVSESSAGIYSVHAKRINQS